MSPHGKISLKFTSTVLFLLLILMQRVECQKSVLDSALTFRSGTVKTGEALDIITRRTGYNFTYDSRLIDQDKKIEMNFNQTNLTEILNKIIITDSLVYTIIDKYIIISHLEATPKIAADSTIEKIRYITGRVIDNETSDPLPFATIAIKNTSRGTVTNNNGEFGMRITPDFLEDTLSVSYLGYSGREIPVRQSFESNLTIYMDREFISIPEIIIKNQNPLEIISRATRFIPRNYGHSPSLMTGFYREGIMKKSELQTYSEAVLQIYKSSYAGGLLGDQIKVFKSRKIENVDRSDTLAIRLKAGLSTSLELDGAKNIFDFLGNPADYTYRMSDIVTYDDEAAYAVEFEQRENVELPLFKGTIFINTLDYGILDAQFEINPKLIGKLKDSFVSTASREFNTWPSSVKYSVSYRKMNDRYFLSHVRGDLVFTSSQKRKLFRTQFRVFFELAITETVLTNVERFEREELAPIHSVFSRTIKNYDPQFWGNQDFLRPEDNLIQALKKMKVKLQEFSE